MRQKRFQKTINKNKWNIPISLCLTIAFWVVSYVYSPTLEVENYSIFKKEVRELYLLLPQISVPLITLLLTFFSTFLIVNLNNVYSLIRTRTNLNATLFLIMMALIPYLHQAIPQGILVVTYLISIFFLFKIYQQKNSNNLFNSFVFIGLSSLIFPPITILALCWFIATYQIESLNIKSILKAIIGWLLPYWFLFAHAYYYDNIKLFYAPFQELTTFTNCFNFSCWNIHQCVVAGTLFLTYLVSYYDFMVNKHKDKIKTRNHLSFIYHLTFWMFVLMAIQPIYYINMIPLLIVNISILGTHYFALTDKKTTKVLLLTFIILLLINYYINVWMNL